MRGKPFKDLKQLINVLILRKLMQQLVVLFKLLIL